MMWIVIPALIVCCSIVVALLPAPSEELLERQAESDRVDLSALSETREPV